MAVMPFLKSRDKIIIWAAKAIEKPAITYLDLLRKLAKGSRPVREEEGLKPPDNPDAHSLGDILTDDEGRYYLLT
eukprot:scaffold53631_cov43-Tisochrysis_lutea.AAC.2